MYFEAVFSFYVLLYHFVGHSFFGLIAFRSFSNIIKWNFSLTLAKLNFYVDMSVWLFVGKQYNRLHMLRIAKALQNLACLMGYLDTVSLGMIRKAKLSQIGVALLQICVNFFVFCDFLIFQMFCISFCLFHPFYTKG